MRRITLLALLLLLAPWALAQRGGGTTMHSAGAYRGSRSAFLSGWTFGGHHRYDVYDSLLYPYGFPLEDSYLTDSTSAQAGIQPIVLVQTAPSTPDPPPQPLLIELQGDRYVLLSSQNSPESSPSPRAVLAPVGSARAIPAAAHAASTGAGVASQSSALVQELAPVILIFHDGHSEEIRDYSIASGMIYARGNYYTDGYWTKQFALAALDLPETFKANEARGVRFVLPASAIEVVTRP